MQWPAAAQLFPIGQIRREAEDMCRTHPEDSIPKETPAGSHDLPRASEVACCSDPDTGSHYCLPRATSLPAAALPCRPKSSAHRRDRTDRSRCRGIDKSAADLLWPANLGCPALPGTSRVAAIRRSALLELTSSRTQSLRYPDPPPAMEREAPISSGSSAC